MRLIRPSDSHSPGPLGELPNAADRTVASSLRSVFYIDQTCRQPGLSRSAKTKTRPTVGRSE